MKSMWYILKIRSGKEKKVKEVLSGEFSVLLPCERKVEVSVEGRRKYRIALHRDKEVKVGNVKIRIKNGKVKVEGSDPKVKVEVKDGDSPLKGYLFVRGNYNHLLNKVENLNDVFGFLVLGGKVRTLSDEEVRKVMEKVEKGGRLKELFPEKGGRLKVVSGDWIGAEGVIEEVYEDMTVKARLRIWNKTFTAILPLEKVILI